ncbi:MAG: hypothetical protein KDE21_05625 [Novosphingobium sp.]|nr:hypothetical protein [Novosphingobium sp.]
MHATAIGETNVKTGPTVPRLSTLLPGAVALKLVLLFVLAWNSRFVMDEFWQLGQSKFLFDGYFDTIWPGKAVGYAFFYKPAHWIGWNAGSTMLAGRLLTSLLGCGTLAMVYACARTLGEDKTRSLLVVLVLLGFSTFMERIFRTISEPLAVFFAVAALLALLRGNADRPVRIVVAGVLAGLSFLATQKAIYFDVALGLALVGDALATRRLAVGMVRGTWLVAGWLLPVTAYCLVFGGADPLPVLDNLLMVPADIATRGGAEAYGGLRLYVWQTLSRNAVLYAACFAGLAVALARFSNLETKERIALIFTLVVAVLVFTHSEPWPYVFIMALPFLALWPMRAYDRLALDSPYRRLAFIALAASIALSFATNLYYLRIGNRAQLDLVARAEAMLQPSDTYFDGIGMLPDRRESTPLWLDKRRYLITLNEGEASVAYRGLRDAPPKLLISSYRLDAIRPVIDPLIRDRYVAISPNIRITGRQLHSGASQSFDPPVAGRYALYGLDGSKLSGEIEIDGASFTTPVDLAPGKKTVRLRRGAGEAYLLPDGLAEGDVKPGPDDPDLFRDVYN